MKEPSKPQVILQCFRCGYKWKSRAYKHPPVACASCKSRYWNKPLPEVPTLKGGALILFLRKNAGEVLAYHEAYGPVMTQDRYHISEGTLKRFLDGEYGEVEGMTEGRRAFHMAQIALASNAELRAELREMRAEYERLVENITERLTGQFVKALRGNVMPLGPGDNSGCKQDRRTE